MRKVLAVAVAATVCQVRGHRWVTKPGGARVCSTCGQSQGTMRGRLEGKG